MQPLKQPVLKDVVLIGAGHAHVAVLRMFGMAPLPGARFTLITREVHSPYSGMLPGLIAGHYRFDDAHIDTAPLARFAGARLYQDEAIGLDLANRRVICRNRPPVPYDLLSIDIGSTPNTAQISGAVEHAIPVKPIDGFLARFMAMKQRVLARKGGARIAVIGGGAGGVELMLSVAHRLRREAGESAQRHADSEVEKLPRLGASKARAYRMGRHDHEHDRFEDCLSDGGPSQRPNPIVQEGEADADHRVAEGVRDQLHPQESTVIHTAKHERLGRRPDAADEEDKSNQTENRGRCIRLEHRRGERCTEPNPGGHQRAAHDRQRERDANMG